MDLTHIFTLKTACTFLGGFLLMVGSTIEPSVGVWIVSLGGSLLYLSLSDDRSLFLIFVYLVIGLFFGIFGSQLFHAMEPLFPQIALSFLFSIFGVNITYYVIRNLKTTTFVEIIVVVLDKIIPWKGKK